MAETRRHVLEELLTKARTLNDDSGYDPAFNEETLWDTLVFGLRSDKGRKDAISKGNSFTFQQVYHLAKTEESTKVQMQAITRGYQVGSVHSKKKTKIRCPRMKSDKVAHVVQGLRAGFHLGFNYSTSLKSATGNMASALLNPQVVENYLQSDRQGGGPLSSASPPPPSSM